MTLVMLLLSVPFESLSGLPYAEFLNKALKLMTGPFKIDHSNATFCETLQTDLDQPLKPQSDINFSFPALNLDTLRLRADWCICHHQAVTAELRRVSGMGLTDTGLTADWGQLYLTAGVTDQTQEHFERIEGLVIHLQRGLYAQTVPTITVLGPASIKLDRVDPLVADPP